MELGSNNLKKTIYLSLLLAVAAVFCQIGYCRELPEQKTVPGGARDSAQNSLEIEDMGRFAVQEHNKKENTLLEFTKVVKAKEQVVAGKMYYLMVEVNDGGKSKMYEAKVLMKPWMNFKQLQEFKEVHGKTMPGGARDSAQNDLEIEDMGRFAVKEHNKKENTLLEFVKVVKAKEQVVAGKMYYLTVEVNDGGKSKMYEAKVLVKPWMNFKQLQEFKEVHGYYV